VTAWILGHYVTIENQNIKEKNMQLSKLNNKLSKQEKQRKNIEKMLLKNERCYNLLIDNSKEAIFIHNFKKIIFANESAARIIGFSKPEDLNGKSISDFVPNNEKKNIKRKFSSIYKKKETTLVFEQKVIDKDSTISSVQNTSTYIIYDGKPALLTILHDITPEKQVKKLQRDVEENVKLLNQSRGLNKLITQFLANISHELKTPLNVIFSAIQLLNIYNTGEHKSKREKYLIVMKHNCYRLMKLINNLLDITKLDSGFLKLKLKNYNIVSVVEDIASSVRTHAQYKNISLTFDTNVEEKIMAFDLDKVEKIILNLMSNSIKFTKPKGHIFVNVVDKIDKVYICIRDTGIGIPKDKLNIIFKRFGQVDKTLNRNCEGSGVGLYLVKCFANMHGGKIKVKSELGKGSEFILELPVRIVNEIDERQDAVYENNIERVNIEFSDIYYDSVVS
jgi:PAS domain S-box-containing protein